MTKKPETRIKVLNTERYQLYWAQYKSTHLFGLISIWVDIRPTWQDSVFVATLEKAKERIDDFLRRLETGEPEQKRDTVTHIKYPEETKSNE